MGKKTTVMVIFIAVSCHAWAASTVSTIKESLPKRPDKQEIKHLPEEGLKSLQETKAFQKELRLKRLEGSTCWLQAPAFEGFKNAIAQIETLGSSVTLRGEGYVACLRSYGTTEKLWRRRVFSALERHVNNKKICKKEANEINKLGVNAQVKKVIEIETERGLLFGKLGKKSIIFSTEIPTKSEHLAGVALDLIEYDNLKIVSILNSNGWYQIKFLDPNHFSYLGGKNEQELSALGLRKRKSGNFYYWSAPRDQKQTVKTAYIKTGKQP